MPDLNKAYQWAIQTCNSPVVGYWTNSDNRNQRTVNGITYYDCSSFINYALLAGGWSTPSYAPTHNAFTTGTMPAELRRLGWTQVNASGQILPGDIGLSSSHTEMCYQGGVGRALFMGAHYGRDGDKPSSIPLPYQVCIGNSSGDATATRTFPEIWRYGAGGATGYGVSFYVISAICGNAWQESNINPGLHEVGGTGFGLFQWSNTPDSDRRTRMEAWMVQHGYALTDPNGQLEYLIYENFWQPKSPYPFNTLEEFLNSSSTDIEMLVRAWEDCWEISNDDETLIRRRINWAIQCGEYITAHAQDTSIIEWYIRDGYLQENEILNNAVMMYRYLSAGGGGGGTIGEADKGMPLWMKIRYHY